MNSRVDETPPIQPAGFWIRLLAILIDFLLIEGIEFTVNYAISRVLGLDPLGEQISDMLLSLGFYSYYFCVFPIRFHATLGKKWLGIEVVQTDGAPLTTQKAFLRLFGYLLSLLMMGCGFLMVAFHPQKRAFHDLISGTMVVRKRQLKTVS